MAKSSVCGDEGMRKFWETAKGLTHNHSKCQEFRLLCLQAKAHCQTTAGVTAPSRLNECPALVKWMRTYEAEMKCLYASDQTAAAAGSAPLYTLRSLLLQSKAMYVCHLADAALSVCKMKDGRAQRQLTAIMVRMLCSLALNKSSSSSSSVAQPLDAVASLMAQAEMGSRAILELERVGMLPSQYVSREMLVDRACAELEHALGVVIHDPARFLLVYDVKVQATAAAEREALLASPLAKARHPTDAYADRHACGVVWSAVRNTWIRECVSYDSATKKWSVCTQTSKFKWPSPIQLYVRALFCT